MTTPLHTFTIHYFSNIQLFDVTVCVFSSTDSVFDFIINTNYNEENN
jgi:hypothetical protein